MSRMGAYARLVRLPNVFTACANVSVGLLAGGATLFNSITLLLASACCYCAGMAFNDYFDRHIDAAERPHRPIPSGVIAPKAAFRLAATLCVVALGLSAWAGWFAVAHAGVLLLLILAYDAWLKSTLLGPYVMGGCRFANILLGFALTNIDWPTRLAAAGVVGLYISGVTLFASDEAGTSRRPRLLAGLCVCFTAVVAGTLIPASSSSFHPYLLTILAIILLNVARPALANPGPLAVQRFVKTAILGLVLLDAALAIALAGPAGFVVLIWLIPAVLLGRRIYST